MTHATNRPQEERQNEPVRAAIDRLRKRRPGVGEAPLFPHPKDPSKPVTRFEPSRWLRNAEKLAGLEPQEGSAWHAFRRAWATQRKHLPAVDVAKAGGWARVGMVTDIYQQADQETTLRSCSAARRFGRCRGGELHRLAHGDCTGS